VSQLANTSAPMTLKSVALGLVTISAFAFIVGFAFGAVNNTVVRRIANIK
jgi:hypothetical protein